MVDENLKNRKEKFIREFISLNKSNFNDELNNECFSYIDELESYNLRGDETFNDIYQEYIVEDIRNKMSVTEYDKIEVLLYENELNDNEHSNFLEKMNENNFNFFDNPSETKKLILEERTQTIFNNLLEESGIDLNDEITDENLNKLVSKKNELLKEKNINKEETEINPWDIKEDNNIDYER